MKVLVTNIMMLNERQRFEVLLRNESIEPIFPSVDQFLKEEELLSMVGDFDGWLAGDDQITRKVLEKSLPKLKVISKWGTGTDSIDKVAAKELGVPVFNTTGAFGDAVSEIALSYMLSLSRKVLQTDRAVRNGEWPKYRCAGLVGKKLGIVGFGAIGKGIASRASAFKMSVCASDPFFSTSTDYAYVEQASLDSLVASCDYVCLACNLSEDNFHLINRERISKMKKGAVIINVARGPLIDELALIEALQSGQLSGAGLDVFEIEPLSSNNVLLSMENVILGTHNANNTDAAVELVHENTLQNLFNVLKPN
jgi:D-3-phosphoglycerate dehydrogenase